MSVRVATSWDSIPPVMYDGDEAISTRVLERQHRLMREALESMAFSGQAIDPETPAMALDEIFGNKK